MKTKNTATAWFWCGWVCCGLSFWAMLSAGLFAFGLPEHWANAPNLQFWIPIGILCGVGLLAVITAGSYLAGYEAGKAEDDED
jgi:hypothetical protein